MAINTQKFLPLAKSSSAIVKSAGSNISTEKNKGGAIIKQKKLDIKKFIPPEKQEEKKEESYGAIIKSLVSIDKFLKSGLTGDKKTYESEKQEKKEEKSKEREKKLETKEKPKGLSGISGLSLPKFDFLESVKRYFLFTFLGWLFTNTQQYLPQLLKIVDIIKPVISVAEVIFKGLLEGFIGFIDLGYKAYDTVRGVVKDLGGEGAQKTFDDLSKNLNTLITTTILVAGAIATLGDRSRGTPGTPSPRGRTPGPGVPRSLTGRPIPTTSGGRPLGRPDVRNPLRERPRVTGTGGGRAGGLDIRNPLRQGPKVTTTGGARAAGRFSGKGLGKLATRGAPIIGPLLDFGIRTLIFKESPGRAAAGSIGLGVGQALGGLIGGSIGSIVGSVVPIAGTLLGGSAGVFIGQLIGGFIGDWIGTSLYDAVVTKKDTKVQKKEKGGSVYGKRKPQGRSRRSIKLAPRKPIKKQPTQTQPGKDVGGEKKIIELYSKEKGSKLTGLQKVLAASKDKELDTTLFTTLVKNSKTLKDIPLVGRFFGAGLDVGALGQALDKNLTKGFAEELSYIVQLQSQKQVSEGLGNIRQAIAAMAEGGTVPQRSIKISTQRDVAEEIEKSLGRLIDQRVGDVIKNMSGVVKHVTGGDKTASAGAGAEIGPPGSGAGGYAEGEKNFVPSKEIYDYLKSKGVSHIHAMGMLANIQAESSFNAGAIGDSGTSGGLFQHHADRFDGMRSYAGKDWAKNWKRQVDYALREDSGKQYINKKFKTAEEASSWFTHNFERPSNAEYKARERLGNLNNFGVDGSWKGPQPGVIQAPKTKLDFKKLGLSVGEKAGYSQTRGRIHAGRDIAIQEGTPLRTLNDSVVVTKGYDENGYGHYIVFRDKNGRETLYGHLRDSSNRKEGDKLLANSIVGYVGSSGRSTGPHLHWEVSDRSGEVGVPRRSVSDPLDLGYAPEAPFGGEMNPKPQAQRLESEKSFTRVVNGQTWKKRPDGRWQTGSGRSILIISNADLNQRILQSRSNNKPKPQSNWWDKLNPFKPATKPKVKKSTEPGTAAMQGGGLIKSSRPNIPNIGKSAYYDEQGSTVVFVPIETQVMVPVPTNSSGGSLMFPSSSLNIKDTYPIHSLSRG